MIRFVRDFLRVANRPCRDQTAMINRQFDAPLSRGEALGLRTHLFVCEKCRRFLRQVALLRELSSSLGREPGSTEPFPDDVRERLIRLTANEPPTSDSK